MWWVIPAMIAGVKFMGSVKERQDKEHWADVRAGLMEDTAQENLSNAYTALAGKRSLGQQDIFAGMGERIAKNSEFASKSYGDAAQVIASGAGSGAEINAFSTPAMIASNVINDADMAIKSNTTLMKVESQRQLTELKFADAMGQKGARAAYRKMMAEARYTRQSGESSPFDYFTDAAGAAGDAYSFSKYS